jgi:hypothetical protein
LKEREECEALGVDERIILNRVKRNMKGICGMFSRSSG